MVNSTYSRYQLSICQWYPASVSNSSCPFFMCFFAFLVLFWLMVGFVVVAGVTGVVVVVVFMCWLNNKYVTNCAIRYKCILFCCVFMNSVYSCIGFYCLYRNFFWACRRNREISVLLYSVLVLYAYWMMWLLLYSIFFVKSMSLGGLNMCFLLSFLLLLMIFFLFLGFSILFLSVHSLVLFMFRFIQNV